MNLIKTLVLALVLLTVLIHAEESKVVVLGDSNLTQTLKNNDYVMLQFYAPWCGHCKTLAPEYEKLPDLVAEHNVVIAKIDATVEKESGEQFEIKGFPTLKFHLKGTTIDYKGGRTAAAIAGWINKVVTVTVDSISEEDAAEKAKGKQVVIIRTNKPESVEALRLASLDDETTEYFSVESDVESVTLYTEGSDAQKYDGQLTTNELSSWITRSTLPTIIPLKSQSAMDYVFSENKNDIIIIVGYNDISDSQIAALENFCKERAQEFVCTICGPQDDIYQGVKGFLKFEDEQDNKIAYIESGYTKAYLANFKPEQSTAELLTQWKNSIENGKEESVVPEAGAEGEGIEYKSVVVLTGQSFEAYVKQNPQTLVEFYADFCGHCKQFAPVYEKFAEELIAEGSEYKIAAVNCEKEQDLCREQSIAGYPSIKFFYKGMPIEYEGGRVGAEIKEFMDAVQNSKPEVAENVEAIQRPAAIIYDPAEETELNMIGALFRRHKVYHIRDAKQVKIQFLSEEEDFDYTGELEEADIAEWLKKVSQPSVVDLGSPDSQSLISPAFEKGLPMLMFLVSDISSQDTVFDHLKSYCKNRQEQVFCGYVEKESGIFENIVGWLSLKQEQYKTNVLIWVNSTSTEYVVYDEGLQNLNLAELEEFVDEATKGNFEEDADEKEDNEDEGEDDDNQEEKDDEEKDEDDDGTEDNSNDEDDKEEEL